MNEKYRGMTVNERLYEGGVIDEFDKAVREKNVDEVIFLLKKVDLNEQSIAPNFTTTQFVRSFSG